MYNNDTIGPGSKDVPPDTRVADLQKRLGITPQTGVFGPAEKKAVEDLQKRLGVNVDGKFGPETKALFDKDKTNQTFVAPNPTDKKGAGDKASASSAQDIAAINAAAGQNTPSDAGSTFNDFGVKPGERNSWDDSSRPGLDPKKGKPDVYDRQKQLAALGAKSKDGTALKTDGIKGNDTTKAEKEFGYLIIDPKTNITVNGATRAVNPNDIKSIQSWIKAVKDGRQKMEQVPPVYADIAKKQLSVKEDIDAELPMLSTEPTLARIIQLAR